MTEESMRINGCKITVYALNTIVVGSGAAGLNAADCLYRYGQRDIAVVTEHINAGTSRNTGSDKQTYYKLTLFGGEPDSVGEMAENLFAGQCVDGDHALCEAALSAQCFFRLAELGVPFPRGRYGEYVGYKTDHDPRRRATSAGPYTSGMMTRCLEKSVREKNIRIFNRLQAIKILTAENEVRGILCLNLEAPEEPDRRYVAFRCGSVIYATGGPAGIYADSVYPFGHYGASGLAFEAGVAGKNLTEWQYGMASVRPRWNVSGTYMQALPRFLSTDQDGGDEREFLFDFFTDPGDLLTRVFLKGYQWPFDVRKIRNGSSVLDLLVYRETCLRGRRVFLDYRANPGGGDIDYAGLSQEAQDYLQKAGAAFGTPIERLRRMNQPAVDFYLDKGVDLSKERLEIAVCAQHNNGGLGIDCWWQTNLRGFFAVGEAGGSHGVYRPGGSALNAGQVGSVRAAQYIAANRRADPVPLQSFESDIRGQVAEALEMGRRVLSGEDNVRRLWDAAARRMSRFGAAVREKNAILKMAEEVHDELLGFADTVKAGSPGRLGSAFRLYDVLLCQYVYLSAMADYIRSGGKSRGSAMYYDENGTLPDERLPERFRFTPDDGSRSGLVQEVSLSKGECRFSWRKVRPIPREDDFFENVWREYRNNKNIY